MKSAKLYLLILAAAIGFSSCIKPVTSPKEVICPVPVQDCAPAQWKGMPYDSTKTNLEIAGFRYAFRPVERVNTVNDEWNLAFYSPNRALMTVSDGDRQVAVRTRMVKPDRGTIEGGIAFPLPGHVGCVSSAGENIVFAVSPDRGEPGRSDLYSGVFRNNWITNIQHMGAGVHQDEHSFESHPALYPGGKLVFFTSDRPYGLGGTDIWFSYKLSNTEWSEPINCGESINSKCDDLTPFVTNDGNRIYFASAGHETVGGYDIFSARFSDKFKSAIATNNFKSILPDDIFFEARKNMRPPLNTERDELFPTSPGNGDSLLYYSSNQAQEYTARAPGGFDLYVRMKIIPLEIQNAEAYRDIAEAELPDIDEDIPEITIPVPPNFELSGKVFNEETEEVIPNTVLTVKEPPNPEITQTTKTNDVGEYTLTLEKDIDYEITAQSEDLFFDTFTINIDGLDTLTEKSHDFYIPVTLMLRINFPTDKYDTPYRFILDSNGVESNITWQAELDNLAKNIIDYTENLSRLLLVGHTDEVGTVEYNDELGQNRVGFVISELIKRGVPARLLLGSSAGELKPLNKREGESLKMFRMRLRRVELQKNLK